MKIISHFTPGSKRHQRGAVLAITLILLVIFSLLGALAIRNAMQGDKVMNGLRTNAVAQQAAESALRFCEQLAMRDSAATGPDDPTGYTYVYDGTNTFNFQNKLGPKPADRQPSDINDAARLWRTAAEWNSNGAHLITVPNAVFQSGSANVNAGLQIKAANAPRCIIEPINVGLSVVNSVPAYLITVRAFSNDAVLDTNTLHANSGAEVWLQSTLTPAN